MSPQKYGRLNHARNPRKCSETWCNTDAKAWNSVEHHWTRRPFRHKKVVQNLKLDRWLPSFQETEKRSWVHIYNWCACSKLQKYSVYASIWKSTSSGNKILNIRYREVERIQLDRHSYEIQIKELTMQIDEEGSFRNENSKLRDFIKKLTVSISWS